MSERKPYPPVVICLDLETTGLDPSRNRILEVAAFAVETPSLKYLQKPNDEFHSLVGPEPRREEMDDFVWKMHSQSSLLEQMHQFANNAFYSAEEVDERLAQWIRDQYDTEAYRRPLLVGFNPDFDRRFLEAHMPKSAEALDYRSINASSFWLFEQLFGPLRSSRGDSMHRATSDCLDVIRQLHLQKERLFRGEE